MKEEVGRKGKDEAKKAQVEVRKFGFWKSAVDGGGGGVACGL